MENDGKKDTDRAGDTHPPVGLRRKARIIGREKPDCQRPDDEHGKQ